MDATWQALGRAAGTKLVGVNRIRVAPGMLPTPPHSHGASEEIYYVLDGSGLVARGTKIRFDICGQRSLTLKVQRLSGSGAFTVDVSKP